MHKISESFITAQAIVSVFVTTGLRSVAERRNERGVVSIEYIVLGAAIILLIGVIGTNAEVKKALTDAFTKLFSDASN